MSNEQADSLLASARALRRAAGGGRRPLLQGRNVALLTAPGGAPAGELFATAAAGLGATLARVGGDGLDGGNPGHLKRVAHLFGCLYDALDCEGIAPDVVQRLAALLPVPVFDGLAGPAHPTATLAAQVGDDDARVFVIQAALLAAIS